MQCSPDVTTDPVWVAEQMDRLLGFEVLNMAVSGDPTPIAPHVLADKIGVYKGLPHRIITGIASRFNNGN